MPAPQTIHSSGFEPSLKANFAHVNLMVDSFIANAEPDDLRAILRTMLSSCPPSTASAFTAAARKRLERLAQTSSRHPTPTTTAPSTLFATYPDGGATPSPSLDGTLRRARALYGAGMGFASLAALTAIARGTLGLRWAPDGPMADTLAAVDADIAQALQSAREEYGAGRVADLDAARATLRELEETLAASQDDAVRWGGEFPFERALVDVQHWKL
ncbi:uncharacterized protein PHACADRAFT_175092 [Phanerochaete carnosa HHB-10118-sp]|uniref:Uncharacterized protein n=1 Tax=Phanerochaete carnosa (strain HHB-10118-sp) TaxID=650164 RepID=K5UWW8_PHACS|nr:uncharacterized protein PHACADRAFT_175092 [Phanerochaete carnosa HHB-10118-sp]EKM54571.1 hypothetical protein PHACADRAFT_175092 [Phanerochaete carnosa HHB-10118-sp]